MKYYQEIDIKNTRIINLFDSETSIHIGKIEVLKDGLIATPIGVTKPSARFQHLACARGYISACIYRKTKGNNIDKQLNLML